MSIEHSKMQTENPVVYSTKDSTHFPSAHQRWFPYCIVLSAQTGYTCCCSTAFPEGKLDAALGGQMARPRLPQSWTNLTGVWPLLQLPILLCLPFSLSICLLIYMIILELRFLLALSGECACSPSSSLMLSYPKIWGVPPHCIPGTWHGYVAGSVALTDPTLNVLSFISQAHYLDRVVKGMVFLPLFSCCLCVCVCV